jgi:hypothetical protein
MHVVDVALPAIEPQVMRVYARGSVAGMARIESFRAQLACAERQRKFMCGSEPAVVEKLAIPVCQASFPQPA